MVETIIVGVVGIIGIGSTHLTAKRGIRAASTEAQENRAEQQRQEWRVRAAETYALAHDVADGLSEYVFGQARHNKRLAAEMLRTSNQYQKTRQELYVIEALARDDPAGNAAVDLINGLAMKYVAAGELFEATAEAEPQALEDAKKQLRACSGTLDAILVNFGTLVSETRPPGEAAKTPGSKVRWSSQH